MPNPDGPRSPTAPGTLQLTNTQDGATGIARKLVVEHHAGRSRSRRSTRSTALATTFHDRLPAAAAQRHLHAPARDRASTDTVRRCGRYQPERGPGRAPRPGPERADDHRRVQRDRSAQGDPGAAAATTPGQVTSTINVPDNFLVQGDTTIARTSAACGSSSTSPIPNDPDLTATLYYDYGGTAEPGRGSAVQRRGRGHQHGQFHQHGLRRQRGHADPERQRAVLRHLQPADCRCPTFAGLNAQGTWTLVITTTRRPATATGTLNSWSLTFQKPLPTTRPGRAGQRQHQRQLPHLHAGPDQRAVGPGLDAGRPGVDRLRTGGTGGESPAGSSGRVRAWRSIRPTPRATPSTSPAPAAASGRPPTSSPPAPTARPTSR